MPVALALADVQATIRTFSVPDRCPSCSADLHAAEALRHSGVACPVYASSLQPTGLNPERLVSEENDPVLLTDVQCAACEEILARSTFTITPEPTSST